MKISKNMTMDILNLVHFWPTGNLIRTNTFLNECLLQRTTLSSQQWLPKSLPFQTVNDKTCFVTYPFFINILKKVIKKQ